MKTCLLMITLTFLIFNTISADGGNCVKYKVTVELKNQEKIQGYLLIGSYDPKIEFKDITFLKYLISLRLDTFTLYTKVIKLNYPITNESPNCEYHYSAVPEKATFKIPTNKMRSVNLLSYSSCDFCKDNDFYYFLSPVMELNEKEIQLLNGKPIADSSYTYNSEMNPNKIWIISYNKSFGLKKINNVWTEYLKSVRDDIKKENWKSVITRYIDLKNKLRTLNIIIFEIQYSI